jgi:hypothetical protein
MNKPFMPFISTLSQSENPASKAIQLKLIELIKKLGY